MQNKACVSKLDSSFFKLNTKEAKEAKDSLHAYKSDDDDDVIITGISTGLTEKPASLAKLNEQHYKLILSPHGWLDCDIVHAVHVCLRKINPGVEGLQRPTLGPCRNFNQVNGEFIHTGQQYWVCVASVGCGYGTVNLCDSLYHKIIYSEVEDQVVNLVGQAILRAFKLFLFSNSKMAATVVYLLLPLQPA